MRCIGKNVQAFLGLDCSSMFLHQLHQTSLNFVLYRSTAKVKEKRRMSRGNRVCEGNFASCKINVLQLVFNPRTTDAQSCNGSFWIQMLDPLLVLVALLYVDVVCFRSPLFSILIIFSSSAFLKDVQKQKSISFYIIFQRIIDTNISGAKYK